MNALQSSDLCNRDPRNSNEFSAFLHLCAYGMASTTSEKPKHVNNQDGSTRARRMRTMVDDFENKEDNTKLKSQIKRIANSTFTRRILINEMIDLSINLQKDKAEELRNLYFELGLHDDSLEKLNNKHWHTRIKGFKECAFMNIELCFNRLWIFIKSIC